MSRFICSFLPKIFLPVLPVMFLSVARVSAAPAISIEQSTGYPLTTGRVVAWGKNASGQTDVPDGLTGVQAIAAGDSHTVALRKDGTVVAWGSDDDGQVTVPVGLSDVRAIAAGANFTVALTGDGSVVCWGSDSFGQSTVPAGLTDVQAIAAGSVHTVALKEDGTVVVWGGSSLAVRQVPAGLSGVVAIAAGASHALALKGDGTVTSWGSGNGTAPPAGLTDVEEIFSGFGRTVAKKTDGSLVTWGFSSAAIMNFPAGLEEVTGMGFGSEHSLALKADHSVFAWGYNTEGQRIVPEGLSGVRAITTGWYHSVALVDSLVAFGNPLNGTISPVRTFTVKNSGPDPLSLQNVSVSGGSAGDFSVSTAGMLTVVPPGGQTQFTVTLAPGADPDRHATLHVLSDDPDEGEFVIALTAARGFPEISVEQPVANRLEIGIVEKFGVTSSDRTELPERFNAVQAISARANNALAVKGDGSVVAWKYNLYSQTDVPESAASGVQAIAAGGSHSLALRDDGTVIAWENNDGHQTEVPAGLSNVKAIAAGEDHSLALKSDGTVVAWGSNSYGLMDLPSGLSNVKAIAAGEAHSVAIKGKGVVVAWGSDSHGQSTVPAGLKGVQAIAAGDRHTVALRSNGTVVAWGDDSRGQSSVPAGLTGVVAISAGLDNTVALKSDGSLVAWGSDGSGKSTFPAGLTGVRAVVASENFTLVLRDPEIDFGNRPLNSTSEAKTFTIRNNGTDFLKLSSVKTEGGHASNFILSTAGMATSVPPGGQTSVTVKFKPTRAGIRRTTLRIVSDDLDEGSYEIALVGTVVPDIAVFSGSGSDPADERENGVGHVSFGDLPVSAGSASQTFTIRNDGFARLSGLALSISGNHPGDFSVSKLSSLYLGPGKTTSFTVTYDPEDFGNRNAVVTIASNDGDESPFEIQVSGKASPPRITIDPQRVGVGAWGSNLYGQSDIPAAAESMVRSIAAGDHHSLALLEDGSVLAWGDGNDGVTTVPAGLSGVQAIAAGSFHSLALRNDGTVVAWGRNDDGQCSVPEGLAGVEAIAAGLSFSAALKTDGTLVAWGYGKPGEIAHQGPITGVRAISSGLSHLVLLYEDGSVASLGNPSLRNVPSGLAGVTTAIAAGGNHALALKNDGTVVGWGNNQYRQRTIPTGLADVKAIAAGEYHSLALKTDGTVVAWGWNQLGQTTVPSGTSGVRAIAAGGDHSLVLTNSAVDFGYLPPSTSSSATTFTIRNPGNDALVITGMELTGEDAADFAIDTSDMSTVIPAGDQTTFTAIFTPAVTGPRRSTLRVTNNIPGDELLEIELTGAGATPPEIWRLAFFGSAEDAGDGADDFDFDYDGLTNLVEYAFGLNPIIPDAAGFPQPQISAGGIAYDFTVAEEIQGITYGAEWSATMAAGDWHPVPDAGESRRHVFSISNGDAKFFMRLRVTRP